MGWEENVYFDAFTVVFPPRNFAFALQNVSAPLSKAMFLRRTRKFGKKKQTRWNIIFPPITMSLQGHHRFTPLLFWILVELLNERTEIKPTSQQLQLFHEGFDDTEDVWLLLYVHLCTMTVMLPCLEEVLHLLPSFTVHEFPGATAKCCTDRGFHPPPAHSQFFQGIRGSRMSESHGNCSETLVSY